MARVAHKLPALPARAPRPAGRNRITERVSNVPIRDLAGFQKGLRELDYTTVELAPAFTDAYARSRHRAVALARAFATTLPGADEHRQLFQRAAYMKPDERLALIEGYRKAGQGRGVVHAISQLPRAHGRLIMRDFAIRPDGKGDPAALREVMYWLRDAGAQMRGLQAGVPPDPDTDDAVVDFFEDVADAISDAVNAVVDAIGAAGSAFVDAIKDVVNWAAEEIASLARALVDAFETLGELLAQVVEAGYEVIRKIIQGLEAIGKAMREILEAAFEPRAGLTDPRPARDRQPRPATR